MRYEYREESGHSEELEASSMGDAIEQAKQILRDCDWDAELETLFVSARVYAIDTDQDGDEYDDDSEMVQVAIDPDEPECSHEDGHDWQSPLEVVDGIKENPGVFGHGGGVIITTVCAHCGTYKTIDTWATDAATGQQGLKSVKYQFADDRSEKWVRKIAAPRFLADHIYAYGVEDVQRALVELLEATEVRVDPEDVDHIWVDGDWLLTGETLGERCGAFSQTLVRQIKIREPGRYI